MRVLIFVPVSKAGNAQFSLRAASEEGAWRRLENAQGTRNRAGLRSAGWRVEPRHDLIPDTAGGVRPGAAATPQRD